jgi:hypothetical protein
MKYELIGEWFKRVHVPTVSVSLKESKTFENVNIQSLGLEIGLLNLGAMSNSSAKKFEDAINRKNLELKNTINEQNKKIDDQNKKLDDLIGTNNLHPLLDFVSKFRIKIIEYLANQGTIPNSCTNWDSMYDHLAKANNKNKIEIWNQIDLAAEDLGLDYDDWFMLKNINHKFYNEKQPNPRLTKEAALIKIEKLNGTWFGDCYAPLKSIINIFEKNKWL